MTPAPRNVIRLTIDGRPIDVPAGTSVLDAARKSGIFIPTLCHHPLLRPEGACRLCLVEVEGARAPVTSCTLTAAEGMVVRTDTPDLRSLRREILSYTLSEHPYICLVCDRRVDCREWQTTIRKAGVTTGCENCPKNGQCELQILVEKVGLTVMPYPIAYRGLAVEKDDPFFDRDYNLCVLCGRCVRMCQEVRLSDILGFLQRGAQTRVGAVPGLSHIELDCEFCGACVDVCPTGALFDKRTKWEGPPDGSGEVVCPYCSVGCRLELRTRRGRVIGVRPAADGPANAGQACVRGRYGLVELVHAENRISAPLIRRDGRLVETGWEEALSAAAEKLARYRGDAFALLGSPHLTSEAAFVLSRFAREVMKTRSVDCAVPIGLVPQVDARQPLPTATIEGIRQANCILVMGSNPRLSHPVVAVAIRQAVRRGAKLIVLDPRQTELARRAHLWVRIKPGDDAAFLGMLASPRGRKTADAATAVNLLTENTPAVIIVGSGVTLQSGAAETFAALQKLAGQLRPPAGILTLAGPANSMGVSQARLAAGPGDANYAEIAAGIESGKIHALYTVGELPPLPGLERLDLLIVQDLSLAPHLKELAHYVFPAASAAEAGGTMTNLEGRDQTWDAVIPAIGNALPDWKITAQLSAKMSGVEAAYGTIESVRADLRAASAVPARRKESARGKTAAHLLKGSLLLIAERNAFACRSFSLTRGVAGMREVKTDEDCVLVHPQDAAAWGIQPDDLLRIESKHGVDTKRVRLNAEIMPETLSVSINSVEGSPLFPGGLPREKSLPVRVSKAEIPSGLPEQSK